MPRKRKTEDGDSIPPRKDKLEDKLIENLVELQKVHTNLLEKFDKLTTQISNLLTLFEMTARSFGEHPANQITQKDKEFLEKIDKLLEQNKTIAKGLTLMDDRMREKLYGSQRPAETQTNKVPEEEFQPSLNNTAGRQLPRF